MRQCLRDGSGFGIVLIETGSEVARTGQKLDIHRTGTYCEVVDWNQLPNGLLGITVEGRSTFRVVETWREANNLCKAAVNFRLHDSVWEPAPARPVRQSAGRARQRPLETDQQRGDRIGRATREVDAYLHELKRERARRAGETPSDPEEARD